MSILLLPEKKKISVKVYNVPEKDWLRHDKGCPREGCYHDTLQLNTKNGLRRCPKCGIIFNVIKKDGTILIF